MQLEAALRRAAAPADSSARIYGRCARGGWGERERESRLCMRNGDSASESRGAASLLRAYRTYVRTLAYTRAAQTAAEELDSRGREGIGTGPQEWVIWHTGSYRCIIYCGSFIIFLRGAENGRKRASEGEREKERGSKLVEPLSESTLSRNRWSTLGCSRSLIYIDSGAGATSQRVATASAEQPVSDCFIGACLLSLFHSAAAAAAAASCAAFSSFCNTRGYHPFPFGGARDSLWLLSDMRTLRWKSCALFDCTHHWSKAWILFAFHCQLAGKWRRSSCSGEVYKCRLIWIYK